MAKTAMVRARITPDLKPESEKILKKLGLTSTEAITMFYTQIKLYKGLPFDVRIPNKTTLDILKKQMRVKSLLSVKMRMICLES